MAGSTPVNVASLRASVKRTRRISDKIIGVGPFTLGLDGVLAWIPGAGVAYSVAAGAFLMVQGVRAQVPARTLARMGVLLVADSLFDLIPVPLAPAVADMVFTGHKWAADALLCALDETIYYPGSRKDAEADPHFQETMVRVRSGAEPRKRVIFLG